jgi:membrane associated rhomboid family serine protease
MIPVSDENPTLHTPVVTIGLLVLMGAAFVLAEGAGFDMRRLAIAVCDYGLVPGELTHRARLGTGVPIGGGLACVVDNSSINWLTPLTSMFLHGGWAHLLGNALFFWVFGDNIEDSMGSGRFLVFYLICGLVAAGAHVLTNPASPVPTVGASGAISGVLGAYLVLYPRARVNMLFIFIFFIRIFPIPAWAVLMYWFVSQILLVPELSSTRAEVVSGGVAVWAHIGGFVAGMALIKLFEDRRRVAARLAERAIRGPWVGY